MKFSRSPLLAFAAASLLAGHSFAATTSGGAVPNLSSAAKSESEAEASSTAAAAASSTAASNTDSAAGTASATGSNTDSAAATTPTGTKSLQSNTLSITGGSSATASGTIPTITGGSSATGTDSGLPKGLPSITGAFVIVAPSVPPTADAPYMQVSNLPEGTVFIVVGAVLGFMAMSVLLWRALVAWSLHRSVKRAAAAQYNPDTKTLFRTPPAPFYKYSDRDSVISLGMLGSKNAKRGSRPPTAPGLASAGSLFFSPTAAAGTGGLGTQGNRGSNYLPAGYYASGAAQPGNGQGMAHIGQHGPSISLSNLGPGRDGYARARSMGPSPPDSPSFRPQSSGLLGHAYGASSSTLNLNGNGGVRAPSAVLDDFFDGENAPPVPGHGRHGSTSQHF
ncbi:Vacuolar membrane [Hyphodiscus hymeniophilus]|uniref:Vacuolar membrane n=1 Tax=Hyphodiscus hymeniophilus TaxID=353542 RepID=A0A9P6SLI5_9HELO|nr:Vacuolar membrane [Hyphodiscus hymeniophilus]